MLHQALKFAGNAAAEHLIQNISDTLNDEPAPELTDEQKIFDQRIRMAQKVLGALCPPAGTAMFALEHGPVIVAGVIKNAYMSKNR